MDAPDVIKRYKEIFKCEMSPGRWIVCSRTFDKKIAISQLVRVKNARGEIIHLFLKNAIFFEDDDSFDEFRTLLSAIDLKTVDTKNFKTTKIDDKATLDINTDKKTN